VRESCFILLMKYSRTKCCPELEPPHFCTEPFNNVNSPLGSLQCVDVDRVAAVSEVHVASTFRFKVSRVRVLVYQGLGPTD
jgi:hypothetical protein